MFGVGGGIITVPFFVAFFIQFGFEEEIIIHMAVGTSLGCIVFTGISSAYAHSKKNAISYNSIFNFIINNIDITKKNMNLNTINSILKYYNSKLNDFKQIN